MGRHLKSHRAFGALLAAAGFVAVQAAVVPARAQTNPPTAAQGRPELEQQLLDRTGGNGRVARHAATGQVRFFGTDQGHAVARGQGVAASAPAETKARGFLATYGSLFGVADEARQLRVQKSREADQGRSNVRFQQVHNEVPVLAGELLVNLDRNGGVLSAGGEVSPDLRIKTDGPEVPAADAGDRARALVAKDEGIDPADLGVAEPSLWIYDPALLGGLDQRPPSLVWRTEVTHAGDDPIRELVLVDARTGAIALHFDQIAYAKDRRICDRNNVVGASETCTAPYTRSEGGPATGIVDVDTVYTYFGNVYDYYLTNFGRDGINGAGLPMRGTTRYCPPASEGDCPFDNAYWTGSQMVFGQGFISDDLVGHEVTHGVTDSESNLFYYFQSGAINESLSDVFGEFIDLGNGLGNDTAGVRWLHGEDLAVGVARSMSNPPAYGDPDAMDSPNYVTGYVDAGGVHSNSGVNNKAAYLMVDGGTFKGVTVTGLGLAKVAQIYYEANANLLTSGSDYQDLHAILKQACLNKVGTAGIVAADCTQAENAANAVRMYLTAPSTAPEAPVCPAGETKTDLFFDDMENPSSGNWTVGGTGAGGWAYSTGYATSGVRSLYAPNPEANSDRSLTKATNVVPPAGKTTYLRFNHNYDVEGNYDGGVVEYTTNNGSSWNDAGSLFVNNGYNRTNNNGPLSGRQVFSDFSRGYISSRLNLSSLAGQNVRFRFRAASDSSVGYEGWDIDDLRVYTCQAGAISKAVTDFDGNGTTDIAVYRPSNGTWYVRNGITATWGASGDVPVPGDFDGNGTTDIAVYRPSNGTWYVRNGATVAWGASGDVPVPGDYDGNGSTDIAVYRPSNGTWFVRNGTTAVWGISGDVPVPGDYDGNGTTDIAVYRPSNGTWYVRGGLTAVWGVADDVPVPGKYDANATTDIAVFRPSNGTWFVRNGTTAAWGVSGDVPVPGDYDGNGTTDIAVYRPSNGTWFVRNGATAVWGISGDIALALPFAIRSVYFP